MRLTDTVELKSGRQMPVLGLGTWGLTNDTANTIADALRLGYRMIDTSGDYGTQPGIAQGIKRSGVDRQDVYIVTKVEESDDAYEATKENLSQLELGGVNLSLIHRPPERGNSEDLWRGLMRAREDGLTDDIGVSNYSIGQIKALADASGEFPSVNQIEWSPFGYDLNMLDFCQRNHIIIQAYSPLTRATQVDRPLLNDVAKYYGKSPAQILIRWNLQMGTVPLPKANRMEHLRQNIDVFDFELSDEDVAVLNHMNEHFSALSSVPMYMK